MKISFENVIAVLFIAVLLFGWAKFKLRRWNTINRIKKESEQNLVPLEKKEIFVPPVLGEIKPKEEIEEDIVLVSPPIEDKPNVKPKRKYVRKKKLTDSQTKAKNSDKKSE